MRTSLRDPRSRQPVEIIVPDQFCADFLVNVFGTAETRKVGDLEFQKSIPMTPAERNRRSRFFKIKKNSISISIKSESLRSLLIDKRIRDKTNSVNQGGNYMMFLLTFHEDVKAFSFDDFRFKLFSLPELIRFFRTSAKGILKTKEEGYLFNMTEFDPQQGALGMRRQEHFVAADGLILDFDSGDLSPEQFEQIFWHEAGRGLKRSFLIANSFSRSPGHPNRFRVIFPFKRSALSIGEVQAVYDSIVKRLEGHGYTEASMKLDRNCRSGVQSFYVPCTNRQHSDWAFLRSHGMTQADFDRFSIDPASYFKTAPSEEKAFWTQGEGGERRSRASEAEKQQLAMDFKASINSMSQGRHRPMFDGALKLAQAGFTEHEVEIVLRDISGQDRRLAKKERGIMASLRSYGIF